MKVYQAIIWFSLLALIGEALVLSEFDFMPLGGSARQGQILGDSTNVVLEDIGSQNYPASYYLEPVVLGATLEPEALSATDTAGAGLSAVTTTEAEISETPVAVAEPIQNSVEANAPSDDPVGQMLEVLNTPSSGESVAGRAQTSAADSRVQMLIDKNKRFYLMNLQKELKDLRAEYEEPQ
ncbi:MAG: hypothetical protein A2445_05785 [Candidatus Jacksonbacteria bacterium RIFOXYC2_FULL_44_29]|nr:MAG: hypothetical protein UW45_C0008G0037 [Parcubacteria group bacterium GW2011_GWC2_44_22]OGY76021.1 MAG: hypothetical protein A2240_05630 [Candidatus Jacksonbacteria bacterium RIFOXYA2_FULL_43_12]OGY76787.1 MAG: hypothetical protein A2295_00430 [Candidatus Jacksonbacteria bacterium RIFOXYB2_FULL_44_15]OGY79194.1 MAG: hypothetical protein A2445_05785 [Candidatus Jacksonbacteria bacterium RIFOXYC2_FULL_44_29]OGY82087.1 MAG: hypothetical protein A2550_00095 [Candidatus Jacksonbacteria bacteri